MNRVILVGCAMMLPWLMFAQEKTCAEGLTSDFSAGGELRVKLKSGSLEISGSDTDKLKIRCEVPFSPDRAKKAKLELKVTGTSAEIHSTAGWAREIRLKVEVPRNTNLWVRLGRGDVSVDAVAGNKDVQLISGDLIMRVGRPEDYSHADGEVKFGDLNADAFGVSTGGVFRKFMKENKDGKYLLHARVNFGDLVLWK